MRRTIFAFFVNFLMALSLNAQTEDFLDFGKILMGTALEEGTVYYDGEIMPEKFMSYILIGENKIFITSEHFDKRMEISYDLKTDKDNAYTFISIKTLEAVTINLDNQEVFYAKYIDEDEDAKVIFRAKIDMIKSMALLEVLKD